MVESVDGYDIKMATPVLKASCGEFSEVPILAGISRGVSKRQRSAVQGIPRLTRTWRNVS
jgi:hypothetical protein